MNVSWSIATIIISKMIMCFHTEDDNYIVYYVPVSPTNPTF